MAKSGDESGNESNRMDWDILVKEEDSDSGSNAPDNEELALRIAIQLSRVDTDGSSSSVAPDVSSSTFRQRNAGHGCPSRFASLQIWSAGISPSPPAPTSPDSGGSSCLWLPCGCPCQSRRRRRPGSGRWPQ